MNKIGVLAGLMLISALSANAQTKKKGTEIKKTVEQTKIVESKSALTSYQDSVNYAIGMSMGQSLLQFNVKDIDINMVSKGIADIISKDPASYKMSEPQAIEFMQAFFMKMKNDELNAELTKGREFLAKNKTQAGVVELPSGLQYKIVTPGDQTARPKATDTVVVHYKGNLLDGKEFDSSYKRKEPLKFPLDQVIKGWTEGVQLIGKGGKIILFIPPFLAYGDRGAGRDIPGNATLLFEIELIDVNPTK